MGNNESKKLQAKNEALQREFNASLMAQADALRKDAETRNATMMTLLQESMAKNDTVAVKMYEDKIKELREEQKNEMDKHIADHKKSLNENKEEMRLNQQKLFEEMQNMQVSQLKDILQSQCRVRKEFWPQICKQATMAAVSRGRMRDSEYEHDEIKGKMQRAVGDEMADKSILRMVLYGESGHGKSTLANRLVGDNSTDGNEGVFATGGLSTISCTEVIQKYIITSGPYCPTTAGGVSVADVPGLDDTEGRDTQFAADFVADLKGVGFINTLCLVKMQLPPRWSPTFKGMLKQLTRRFGKGVWKHVILVVTNGTKAMTEKERTEILETLYTAAGITVANDLNGKHIPVVVVDLKDAAVYPQRLSYLCTNLLPKMGKFACEDLRSPLDDLMEDVNIKRSAFEAENNNLDTMLCQDKLRFDAICQCIKKIRATESSFAVDAELGDLATMASQEKLQHTMLDDARLPAKKDEQEWMSVVSVSNSADTAEWMCATCGCYNTATQNACGNCG